MGRYDTFTADCHAVALTGEPTLSHAASEDRAPPARTLPELRPIDERYRYTIDLSPLIPWVADESGYIVEIDDRISEYTGNPREDCLGNEVLNAIHADDWVDLRDVWRSARVRKAPLDYEFRLRSHEGKYRWHRSRAAPRMDDHGDVLCWYGTIEDIHDRRVANEAVRWAADHDELTGMFNRGAFMRELHAAFELAEVSAKQVTLVLIDLDQFKPINDRFGHDVGDELLRQVAMKLKAAIPPEAVVGRIGGDEFAVCLNGAHGEAGSAALAAIQAVFAAPYQLESHGHHQCGASLGVAFYPHDAKNCEVLYKCADLALYEAKAGSGMIRSFDGSMRDRYQLRQATLSVVQGALSRDKILPFYQPKVDLGTGAIVGFEALLRWDHPRKGMQPAASVSSVFEDAQLSIALDLRMFERIAEDVRTWKREGVGFSRIAINTSAVRFRAGNVANEILHRINEAGLSPSDFELEMTEDVLIGRDPSALARDLDCLREAGMTVALDDFGTGFASLVHLKHFKIDVIKIDRSFVHNLSDPTNAAIVAALTGLGERLSIQTVAEGIETIEQASRLHRKGCNIGQGYLFSPAVPAKEVPALLQTLSGPGRWRSDGSSPIDGLRPDWPSPFRSPAAIPR